MTDDTALPMLKKLLAISDQNDRNLDLRVLQVRIEGALQKLYKGKDHRFPLAIAIFLKDERRRIVFYAGFSPTKDRQRELNLQTLPHIGTEYANAEKDLIDLSASADYSALVAERVTFVQRSDGNKIHKYRCLSIDGKKEQIKANLSEPTDHFHLSNDEFFHRLLVSTFPIPWPHSKSSLLVSVLLSLPPAPNGKSILAAARDATLGPVVGQLFLSVALAQTALADLTPLIADLQAKSWSRTLREESEATWGAGFQTALYEQVLQLGRTASFPFTAVMRDIEGCEPARRRFSQWLSSHDDLAGAISGIDPYALAALAAVHPTLPLAAVAKREKNRERALRISGSLCEVDPALAVNLATQIGRKTSTAEERHQGYGIALSALTSPSSQYVTDAAWRLLQSVLKKANDDERTAMVDMAAVLVSASREELRNELYKWLQQLISDKDAHDIENVFAIHKQLRTFPIPGKLPHLVTVISQKGGVGKTTLALATARRLARRHSVCLVELDFSGPTLHNYDELARIPYVNAFFEDREDPKIASILAKQTVVDRLSIWPADPNWSSILKATRHARSDYERIVELDTITRLLGALKRFDVVVFDTPAEVKYITRTAAFVTSIRRGTLLLSASMFGPSYIPLLEQYWRLMHAPKVSAALVLNKIRGVDRLATHSHVALHDWLLTSREVPLRAFGMELESAPLLKAFLPASLPLIAIENSETVERATRQRSLSEMLDTMAEDGFAPLQSFLDSCQIGKIRQ